MTSRQHHTHTLPFNDCANTNVDFLSSRCPRQLSPRLSWHNKCIYSEIIFPSYTLHHCSNTRNVRIRVWYRSSADTLNATCNGTGSSYALGVTMTNDTTKCLTNCRIPSPLATCKMPTLHTHEFLKLTHTTRPLCFFQAHRRPENNSHARR